MSIFTAPARPLRTAAAAYCVCVAANAQTISMFTQEITVNSAAHQRCDASAHPAEPDRRDRERRARNPPAGDI